MRRRDMTVSRLVALAPTLGRLGALTVLLVTFLVLLGPPLLLIATSVRVGCPSCVLHRREARPHRASVVPAPIWAPSPRVYGWRRSGISSTSTAAARYCAELRGDRQMSD